MELQHAASAEFLPVFRRRLPGGDYVAIDIHRESARSRVSVERGQSTSELERLVIAEADGDERSAAFGDLYHLAADNAAIARALLRLSVRRAD